MIKEKPIYRKYATGSNTYVLSSEPATDTKMTEKLKKYETISACGIDCGLCPRFYTKGSSACSGCGGLNFRERHPSCGVLT